MEEVSEDNLQHEDLLIKLRGKLNEGKIKLWEPPYLQPDVTISPDLQELAGSFSSQLQLPLDAVLQALRQLQVHSLDRSKANTLYHDTGEATLRVKATITGQKPIVIKVQRKLDSVGSELVTLIANELNVADTRELECDVPHSLRVKLIFNGKVIKPTACLEEQGVKNGAQLMALVMTETPEDVKKEDQMYLEMKATRDDAMLLSECVDDYGEDSEYMKLEDQSGNTIELPAAERRSLMVGLALHERGRTAAKEKNYNLALLLFLEADRTFSECRSSILKSVDNWAVLQLDISWCYLCLRSLPSAADAADRLARAEEALKVSYGEDWQRLKALQGATPAELVLLMRLYLLQGIVAFHQNKRDDARRLLQKAESELNSLRVDEASVAALQQLGWARGAARAGLRAAGGRVHGAAGWLLARAAARERARETHRSDRQRRLLGLCEDGSPVSQSLVEGLVSMGYSRRLAIVALRNSNNVAAEAVRLIQEQPELLSESDLSSEELETSSADSLEPDKKLLEELLSMGYDPNEAKTALRMSKNRLAQAVELLVEGGGHVNQESDNPSTSAGSSKRQKSTKSKNKSKRKARQEALDRLSSAIRTEEDDHLDSSLVEEEQYLVQYKSLL